MCTHTYIHLKAKQSLNVFLFFFHWDFLICWGGFKYLPLVSQGPKIYVCLCVWKIEFKCDSTTPGLWRCLEDISQLKRWIIFYMSVFAHSVDSRENKRGLMKSTLVLLTSLIHNSQYVLLFIINLPSTLSCISCSLPSTG